MKRVMLVLSLLVMSLFVSGYTYNVEMTITNDNKVTLTKTFKMEKAEITKAVCGPTSECDYDETQVREAVSKYVNSDVTKDTIVKDDKVNITADVVDFTYKYTLGDLDDYVGSKKDKFDLLYSNFNIELFSIDGYEYKSNITCTPDENMVLGTFKLTLPNQIKSSNATKDNKNNSYEWDLVTNPNVNFVYKAESNKEIAGDSEYGKIKFNKYMFIALGVIIGLVAILAFVNIMKKDKAKPVETTPQPETPVFNSEVFNERAAVNKPSDINQEADTFQPLDATQHEDVISNKFMDDSFAGATKVEDVPPIEEKPAEEPITLSENKIETPMETPAETPVETPVFEEKKEAEDIPSEPIQNDMSSLAFGGTPIDDKNINEIE